MMVSTFTEGLGSTEMDIKVSEDIYSSKQREATTRQRAMWLLSYYEKVLREERFLSRQI
jgi:hypothetical protein